MEIKLNPLWNVMNKKSWGYLGMALLAFVILSFVAATTPESYGTPLLAAVLFLVCVVVRLFTHYPHSFYMEPGSMTYEDSYYLRYRHSSKNSKRIRTRMTVTGIYAVELHQNALERIFNSGHVVIKGHTDLEFLHDYSDYYTEQIEAPEKHVLYGIRDFAYFRNHIYDYVDPNLLAISVS